MKLFMIAGTAKVKETNKPVPLKILYLLDPKRYEMFLLIVIYTFRANYYQHIIRQPSATTISV